MKLASRLLKSLLVLLSLPLILADYFQAETGKDYGVGLLAKLRLIIQMRRNARRIPGASSYVEHLVMAAQILRVPRSLEGCVVECGSYKGRSAANLSLVCALCERDLELFDSFQGLPEPRSFDVKHRRLNASHIDTYWQGAWCGSLEEVSENIRRYGVIRVCKFNPGYFQDTLPSLQKKCVFVFVDADLLDSVQTVVKFLWPKLGSGCALFTHEVEHAEIASLFFDRDWWRTLLDCEPPGLVGAGSGLGLLPARGGFGSPIGYTIKNPAPSNCGMSCSSASPRPAKQ